MIGEKRPSIPMRVFDSECIDCQFYAKQFQILASRPKQTMDSRVVLMHDLYDDSLDFYKRGMGPSVCRCINKKVKTKIADKEAIPFDTQY